MNKKKILTAFWYLGAIGVGVALLGFVVSVSWIGYDVKNRCEEAMGAYGGDCVEALGKLVIDEKRGYGERNSAIWALGQLGDSRALSTLEPLYTGNIPNREPWNEVVSQYELRKAINLARGGVNIGAWMWRQ